MLFAESIQVHRERQGLTQHELARRLGVRQQTISRWEAGTAVPPPSRVVALEDEFGLERGLLLRAVGYLPADQRSRSPEAVGRILSVVHSLNDTELLLVIDAAWQEYRDRRGFGPRSEG